MKKKFIGKSIDRLIVSPNFIAITVFVIAVGYSNTNNQIDIVRVNAAKLQDSVLVDKDGNRYPIRILRDNNLWMTANLKLSMPGSYCYENKKENCERYGRLYSWESAKVGCNLLGEGWRLPEKEEWQRLTALYGGIGEDSNLMRKGAYKALLYTGTSEFNALLGGGRAPESQYARVEAHGFYWTATESDSSSSWFYNFGKGSQALYQQDGGEKTRAFSVRCVKRI